MTKYQAYPEYKDANGNWMGKVPSHWAVTSLKRVCNLSTGLTPPTSNEANYVDYDSGFSWVRPEDLNEGQAPTTASKFLSINGWDLMRVVPKSSTLICCIGTIGKAGYVQEDVSTNQQITSASFYYSSKYNYYLVKAAREVMEETATGNVIRILNTERLGGIPFLLVPENEAEKIANFLDHETAKIDTLIEKQQQLIALLKEKRQAVISHAVTRGLNPNAPMKNSGVEWLGDVPEHWNVAAIRRYLVEHRQGYYTTDAYVDDGTKLLRITDLRSLGEISINDCPNVPYSDTLKNYLLEEGDVVFARTGGAGSFGVIPSLKEEVAYASYLIRFRFLPKHFNTNYLRFMLVADSFQLAVKSNIHGGVTQNIHAEDIKDTFVASPPLEEQKEISLYLDKQSDKYAELINQADLAIQLMQERRTALISAAVTGKIDVRNWQAPEQSEKTPEVS